MAPSLQTVVRRMRLRPLAGSLDRPVRWVAVSELEDPTPFLEGGELVLTTGMRLTSGFSAYVGRLVERGVAGLGFGVGLTHDDVPAELVEAAMAAGLPLLEVPRETPFIAIGKTVSELLAAEQYDEISRAFAAQGRLTRAALRPEGTHAVIDRLAKEVGGWAALIGESGEVAHATPDARLDTVLPALDRLRRGSHRQEPAERPLSSVALSSPGEHVIVQPLSGTSRRIRGFFAVGAPHPFSPVAHTVVNAAGSLLTLALEQGRSQLAAERGVRAAVLSLLLAGEVERARAALAPMGGRLPAEPVTVLAADGETLEAMDPRTFTTEGLALVEEVPPGLEGPVGVSSPVPYGELDSAIEQAGRALEAARKAEGGTVRFADLAGQGLLALLDPAAAHAFSSALLAPLNEYGSRADLVESLRAYLGANGHWDAAAQRLGVHRHTLRYRMKRVSELLGRDLDDPGVRAELWIALSSCPPGNSRSSRS
ncbi:PucR family transcriptional regulator [Nonomuraea dietziae]|uniref:Purine catabolism regulator n=1 Tax=Nonomuraea dietziae TaxID=65515 RepID=A0A7W5YNM1_9ACTN|nr:PucR family transcriptional regulator [Nonomuraea dietziae]MBB3727627.1 purine catabolism regulator [Nonomuraea dietziae]